jgi:hypothetical protein
MLRTQSLCGSFLFCAFLPFVCANAGRSSTFFDLRLSIVGRKSKVKG